jgi:lipoprotein-anchoring transpeptidase ErfK/SrfK
VSMKIKKLLVCLILMIAFIFTTSTYDKKLPTKEISAPKTSINNTINPNEEDVDNIRYKSNKTFSSLTAGKEPAPTVTIKEELPKPPFKSGDKGVKIEEIQQLLNKYGYKLAVDGIFGASTQDAIINFQHRLELGVDGIVGDQTLAKLNIPPTPSTMYDPNEVIPVQSNTTFSSIEASLNSKGLFSSTSYYIVIDIENQRVNVFNGYKEHWKLIRSMPCATGRPETPTVKGFFSVGDKGDMFRAGSNTICKYYTRFSGNYLFHTILLDNEGNIQDPTLGTPASHGCVRLSIEDAQYIYYNIPFGTTVWSY